MKNEFEIIFKSLVEKAKQGEGVYQEVIGDISGEKFKIKTKNNKYEKYTMKNGRLATAFYCPGKYEGCQFVSNKSGNVQRHMKSCKTIIDFEPPQKKTLPINIDEVKFDTDEDIWYNSITNLANKMEKITESDLQRYNGASESWDIVNDFGKRSTIYGTVGAPIPLLCEFFRIHFLSQSIAWGPSKLVRAYNEGLKKGSRFNDPELSLYYYMGPEEKWIKISKTEALGFLISKFKWIFEKAYHEMNNYFPHASYFWHERLYNKKHPKDHDLHILEEDPLNWQEYRYQQSKLED